MDEFHGTIPHATPGFNAQHDAKALRTAMNGIGCDSTAVMNVLCRRAASERHQMALAFKTMYGKELIDELKSELRGDFEDICVALLRLPAEYDAIELRYAIHGIGTDEADIIEILCTRSNAEVMAIKQAYRQCEYVHVLPSMFLVYHTELENDLKAEASFDFKRFMISMCTGARDESTTGVNVTQATQDAKDLMQAGVKTVGTDESTFLSILAMQTHAQLCAVFQQYHQLAGHDIEQAIEREFTGDIQRALLTLVACARNTPVYFAKRAHQAMQGIGTHDRDLARVCITRAEKDMVEVKQETLYKRTLPEAIAVGDIKWKLVLVMLF